MGGSSNNGRKSAGKRLGCKKSHGDSVLVGHILTRQRGLVLKPGEGVACGRDHTLVAIKEGKVMMHYDVNTRKRHISISDGTRPTSLYPTFQSIKTRLSKKIESQKYLDMKPDERFEYLASQMAIIKKEQDDKEKEFVEQAVRNNSRKCPPFVDMTLL